MRINLSEFVRYAAASTVAFAVDFASLWVLAKILHVQYLVAACISFTAGVVIAYVLCIRYVFSIRRLARSDQEFGIFWVIGLVGLGVNAIAITTGVEIFSVDLMIAKVGSASMTMICNFALRKVLLFTRPAPVPVNHSGS